MFRKIETSLKIRTPAQQIISVLEKIRDQFDSIQFLEDIEYCILMIQSNQLYEQKRSFEDSDDEVSRKAARKQPTVSLSSFDLLPNY